MKPLLSSFSLLLTASAITAADWPQWLGPRRDGSSSEIVAPWKSAPKILWKQPVGEGHAAPVVAGGKVFLFTKLANQDNEQVEAFDAVTGKRVWKQTCRRGPFKGLFGNGPRGTPAVDDGKIYTFGITGVLTCLSAADGGRLWEIDTLKQYKAANLFFGVSCSPLVDGNRVFVNVGGKGASIVALDKTSGKEAWKALDDKASYASPIAMGRDDARMLVFLTGKGLVGIAPDDGDVAWQFPFQDAINESSTTPVLVGDLLVGSSITLGSVGLKLDGGKVKKQWLNPDLNCYFSTPVTVGTDNVYLITGSLLSKQAMLHCVDAATGKKRWTRKNKVGTYHATLLRTGDNKMLLLEEAGNLVLFDPNPKEYRELARAKICGNTWAHPALSNGRLYVRDAKELVCVELK
ncbi:MAG: PQQ-like beta-propeller repeat protein [Gemmataceae bacterium]|nr:PQQ-like beta-propeller repeat protein [Gemmataceae bacterium]